MTHPETTSTSTIEVGGYRLHRHRSYDRETHLWLEPRAGGTMRCGFDPLGAETAGDIVAVSFRPPGTAVVRGEPFGDVEAAKFVGPLMAPISGTIRAHNQAVIANPALLNSDPGGQWMLEIEPTGPADELDGLVAGERAIRAWFSAEIERARQKGMLAE